MFEQRGTDGPPDPRELDLDEVELPPPRPAARSVAVSYGPRPKRRPARRLRAHRATRLDPLIEELLLGTAAMAALGVVIAVAFWLLTGISPWPFVVLAEVVGLGWGIVLLALASPYHGP